MERGRGAVERRGARSGVWGRAWVTLAWVSRGVGVVALFSGSVLLKVLFTEPGAGAERVPLWARVLLALLVVGVGGVLFALSFPLLVWGRRHHVRTITSFTRLRGERYVLYLRPFALDAAAAAPPPGGPGWLSRTPHEVPGLTVEDALMRPFAPLGRVVAVGEPGERLPLLGAQRGYLPLLDWQNTVSELIQGANVVMMSVAPGRGTVWEFTEALRTLRPDRLVLLICCGPDAYDAFRLSAAREYRTRSTSEAPAGPDAGWPPFPELPDYPRPATARAWGKRRWAFPLKGTVTFDQDWRACLTPFDLEVPVLRHTWTLRQAVRRELAPVVEPLAKLPTPRGAAPGAVRNGGSGVG